LPPLPENKVPKLELLFSLTSVFLAISCGSLHHQLEHGGARVAAKRAALFCSVAGHGEMLAAWRWHGDTGCDVLNCAHFPHRETDAANPTGICCLHLQQENEPVPC